MNLFSKKASWIAATLLVATSAFAQTGQVSQNRSCPAPVCCPAVEKVKLTCAYNAPARIEVRGCWDLYASASFTYWQALQDNMEYAIVNTGTNSAFNGTVQNLGFDFEPGFKVALGMNFDHDNWDSRVEYTWFRGNTSSSVTATAPDEIHPLLASPSSDTFLLASERWKLHMDLLDWELGRSYFVGKKLTFRPFIALRGAWIRQNVDVNYETPVNAFSGNVYVDKKSRSWAVGPRVGLSSDWLFCDGFRLFGNGSGDILFTRYTTLKSEQFQANIQQSSFEATQRNLNTVRTHLDLELGLGWGTYFDCNNWHVDFAAGYNFQVFFNQNMFRSFNDDIAIAKSSATNGDLYIQGLTLTVRFDF
jgi:hypothetical protein